MSPHRIGFVGLGNQANENLLPTVAQLSTARITAVCDSAPGRAAAFASVRGIDHVYTEIREMIRSRQVDLIIMACPPDVHASGASLAIEAGLPVFVEKPPCTTTETLSDLIELAEKHRVITGVGLNFRFAHPIQRAQAILNSPRFGGLAHLELRHLANKPRAPMWNLRSLTRSFLLAQTIHAFDLSIALGGTLAEIEADVNEVSPGALRCGSRDASLVFTRLAGRDSSLNRSFARNRGRGAPAGQI